MLNFREHKRIPDMFSDVLPWAALVSEDVVLNKDGSFQSTIKYRGPDLDSSTEEELIVKAAHINNILRRLGSSWALYAEAQRKTVNEYPDSSFPDPLSALIEQKRRKWFLSNNYFETYYYFTLIHLPPEEKTTKLAGKFLNGQTGNPLDYNLILQNFRAEVSQILSLLSREFPEAFLLKGEEILTYLHSTISSKNHRVAMPEVPMYLDSVLPDEPLLGGFQPELGDYHVGVIGILGFPGTTQPGLLDALNRIPIELRWVTRFIPLSKNEGKKELEIVQRKWFSKRKGVISLLKEFITSQESPLSDSDAVEKSEDANQALLELGSDEVSYGYLTTTVILLHKDPERLRAIASEVQRIINEVGFTTKFETVNALEAFLGSIPGNTQRDVRRPLVNTVNLSHLLPGASALWGGQHENLHLRGPSLLVAETGGSTPFRISTHIGDVGHTLILGPTGSGKSTFLNFLEVQFLRYEKAQVYIFDKGGSSYTLTTALGGNHYRLGDEDANLSFQPLSDVHEENEKQWAHEWLLSIAEKENVEITPEIKRAIWDALSSLAVTPKEQRTLHSLTVYLQNIALRQVFEPYTDRGSYGRLLDSNTEHLAFGRFECFEMERLMETPTIVGPVLTYLFHRLEKCFDGSPTLLVLDEAWRFLDNPSFSSKIREWLKTLRKLNVSVIFATQSLSDIDESSIASTIKEACFTKIYLPNAVALQPDATEFYRRFGLNRRQIEILAFSIPKRDYYYTSPLGHRLFQLALDDLSLIYCSGINKEKVQLVKELSLKAKDTFHFNIDYLTECGFSHYAKELLEYSEIKKAA